MPSLAIRQNNPGNLRPGPVKWQGEIGAGSGFCIFDTMQNGVRAMALNLLAYQKRYGIKTARGVVTRWAPAEDHNDTQAYLDFFDGVLGIGPDDPLDFRTRSFLYWACVAIGEREAGKDDFLHGVAEEDLNAGIDAALAA